MSPADPLTDRVQDQLAARRKNSPDSIPEHVRLRVLQEAAADPEVVERLARELGTWRSEAEELLAFALLNVCPTCHGDGEVRVNRSRDPQEAYEERCARCGGAGGGES